MRFRSIWISDVHLGCKHAQVEPLLEFLREHESTYLYLVGDFIDGWELRRRWQWDERSNVLIQKLLRKSRKQTRIVYICGNHDEFLQNYVGLDLGRIHLTERIVHTAADGRRFLVLHGHQFDGLVHFNRLLERIGSRLYNWILSLNLYFNRARRRLGFGYWSIAACLKFKAKSAVRYVSDFEAGMVQIARRNHVQGVICGHVHRAEIRTIGGIEYMNCGDWVESCTALAEDFAGGFRLLRLRESDFWPSRHRTAQARLQAHTATTPAIAEPELPGRVPVHPYRLEPELPGLTCPPRPVSITPARLAAASGTEKPAGTAHARTRGPDEDGPPTCGGPLPPVCPEGSAGSD